MSRSAKERSSPQNALAYLNVADDLPHRSEGESVLIDHLPENTKRVLDLGTGDGRLIRVIKAYQPNIEAIAIDVSPTMLKSARDHFVRELPYGKQKLVELGRALALEPKLLLLDEPSAGMNSEEKGDLIFWIKDIQEELGITILMIEHDMNMVMDISDRIHVINFGKTITEGKPAAIVSHPEVLKAYLGEEEN